MQDVWIFANPIAGRGKGRQIAYRLRRRLLRENLVPHLFFERADSLPEDRLAGAAGVRAAIVIGGDGTLRAVASRLYRNPTATVPPLLIVPLGTANLMGRHLGIAWSRINAEDRLIAALQARRIVSVDAAMANGDLFLLVAGVGIDAHIVHELDRIRRGPIRYASYALPAALALAEYAYPPLTVHVDGQIIFHDRPAMAFVGNIPEYGTGFPLLPHARPDDGLLDVCVTPCRSAADVARLFLQAAAGEHLGAEGVVYRKGKHIRIESAEPVPIQVDGESAGHTPLEIRLLPWRIGFIIPADVPPPRFDLETLRQAAPRLAAEARHLLTEGKRLVERGEKALRRRK